MIAWPSSGTRATNVTRRRPSRRAMFLAGLAPVALLLGYVVATRGPAVAVGLLAVPGAAYLLLRDRLNGLLLGVVVMTTVPYWITLGSAQVAGFRVAAVLALVTCGFAFRTRLTIVDLSVLALALVAILGWLLQNDQPGVGKIVLNELLPFAFFVAARTVPRDAVARVMNVAFYAGAVGALTVFYEAFIGHVVFADPASYSWNATDATIFRPGGIFGSPPGAATVLAMTALCGMPLLREARGRRLSLARLALLVTVTGAIITFTRASILGLAAGLVVYLWLSGSPLLSPRRLVIGLALVLAAAIFVLPGIQGSSLFQSGVVRPGNLAARASIWSLALPVAEANAHNAIFGIGSEETLIASQGGSVPAALAAAPVLISHGTHNEYVLALLEGGLIGLAALIAWIAATLRVGLRGWRADDDPVSAALVGSIVALAIVMLANNALLHPPSLAIAALASGLLVARHVNPGSASPTLVNAALAPRPSTSRRPAAL